MKNGLEKLCTFGKWGLIILGIILIGAACTKQSRLSPDEELLLQGKTFSLDTEKYPSEGNLFPEYQLVPGDVLDVLFQIRSWEKKSEFRLAVDHTVTVKFVHVPELNETQNVKPDGNITLPYVGEVQVAGKTVDDISIELKDRYKHIFREPIDLYITVPEFSSQIKDFKQDLHTAPRGLSRLVTVRPDGYCTFPIAGDVFVANRSLPSVKKDLDDQYEGFLPGLHVDLFLERHAGSTVYVLGQVNRADAYKMPKPINILQAISLAGGLSNQANVEKVLVFRLQDKNRVVRQVNVEGTLILSESRSTFYLKPDDIIYVPRKRIFEMGDVMREVSSILFFRGWGITLGGDIYSDSLIE